MNAGLINRLINLVRLTGHRVIFGNPESGQAVVVMDLAEYEKLIGAGEQEKLELYAAQVEGGREKGEKERKPKVGESLPAMLDAEVRSQAVPVGAKRIEFEPRGDTSNLTANIGTVKLNREIASQKASSGNRNADERPAPRLQNQPVNHPSVQPRTKQSVQQSVIAPVGQLEEEERFYLEPLE